MPIIAALLALPAAPSLAASPPVRACRARQLRLSLDDRDGEANGMSHGGVALSIRNAGPDCTLPALPLVQFLDARGRVLPAVRRAPTGMHPGPVMVPVRLAGGHRAATLLRWVSGPVFPSNRRLRVTSLVVRFGGVPLRAPLAATLYGAAGSAVPFDQPPLRAVEGMAADRALVSPIRLPARG